MGSQTNDCVGTFKRASGALEFWPRWLAEPKVDGDDRLAGQGRFDLRSTLVDSEHAWCGDRCGLPDDSAGAPVTGSVDGVFRNSESEGARPDRSGGQAHSGSGGFESAGEATDG